MLANKDLYEEMKAVEDVITKIEDPVKKAELKQGNLMLKLLHNIRTNLVALMNAKGVELVKPRRTSGDDVKDETK